MSRVHHAKPDSDPRVKDGGCCPNCGKIRYLSRRDAKRHARTLSRPELSAYQCGDYWHLGHLPKHVARGRAPRPGVDRA